MLTPGVPCHDGGDVCSGLWHMTMLMMLQVGAMFDTIQRSNATTSDWAMLLLQLISHEVVDCQTNR